MLDDQAIPPVSHDASGPRYSCANDDIIAERHHHQRSVHSMKSPQRRDIEMIVMRVAEKHRIDRRQVIEVDAGLGHPLRAHEREGTCSLRPNRISEDIHTRHLNQRGCVSHHCYTQARNTLIWLCWCNRNRLWPTSSSTRESPPKNVD